MTLNQGNPRGFAMITAIIMLAVVSAALVVISRQFTFEATRTRLELDDTQLRQLLVAGAQDAAQRAGNWQSDPPAVTWDLQVPAALRGEGAAVSVNSAPTGKDSAEVHVDAKFHGRHQTQLLHFSLQDGRWQIHDAAFGM